MPGVYKLPLLLAPQPEGGYTVTSPALPELVTEGDTAEEAVAHLSDALAAVLELYEDQGRTLPAVLRHTQAEPPIEFEGIVTAA